ncbi:BPSL0067 family protein [Paraburkholderia ferrariae]|uniref:BPSL0067 family protein n=1 Tax=Paraburkholderia ferrariae TaxID=386056 RepID=UPI0005A8EC48|nr:BPSL0067 family protein [Paraburkholderia ferrariae]
MSHILANAAVYGGRRFPNAKGHTECVEFVRQTLNAPTTAVWREGTKIVRLVPGATDPVPAGTPIATFVSGKYPQHGSTGKHAAIYLGQNDQGIQVMDQWNSQNQVRQRTIYWHPHSGGLSNNGNAFSVIEW